MHIEFEGVKQVKITDNANGYRTLTIETLQGDTEISLKGYKDVIPVRRERD